MNAVRKSAIAGSWYPGNPSVLRKDIEKYFQAVTDMELEGDIVGIVAPHAGYVYSGQVAAYAYKLICGKKYDVIIIIGPSHRHAFHGVSIYGRGAYETPLGIVHVDDVLALDIKALSKIVQDIPAAHVQEHSVEIQLPFLQVALGHFCFIPLVMGDQSVDTCRVLAEVIYQATRGKKTLIVGSSDLSHFHSYNEATKLDTITLQHLKNADAEGLLQSLVAEDTEACGGGPMAVAMMAAQKMGANKAKFLKYANSGDVTGDKSSVVGYTAAVYYK
ncbi:MAG: AmmeMemoRadiSam system protein B [Deltaproteobacteria bacterium RBG_19FT_COMBO_43_11]|nr:MAG: AmmeMemoRadiSam system protein B [Deltaproteobacteria bacterium RBG_19FT_COMBO_43_11]